MFTSVLSKFNHLSRLDIARNCFAGCLEEVLESIPSNLEYLCVRECDLIDKDIQYLSDCRHTLSLKELNASKICGLFPDDSFAVSTSVLVRCLKHFTELRVCHLQQNQITDAKVPVLNETFKDHWPHMKGINISDNIISKEAVVEMLHTCSKMKTLQQLIVPFSHNLLEAMNVMEHGRVEFVEQVQQILRRHGRMDLDVKILSLAYAGYLQIYNKSANE